jgi:hypothetical protein
MAALVLASACTRTQLGLAEDASDAGVPDSGAPRGGGVVGTATVTNAGVPTPFLYSHAFLVSRPGVKSLLMLFVTTRPRTCADHLAGLDYVDGDDIYFSVATTVPDPASADGTWHFSGDIDDGGPDITASYLQHQACGKPAVFQGATTFVDNKSFLQLTAITSEHVTGTFKVQFSFDYAPWDGPSIEYLEGSFDTPPCLLTMENPPDPTPQYATLPSATCPAK